MNREWSTLKIVQAILRTSGADEARVCNRLGLAPEEFDRYCNHMLRTGLVEMVADSGYAVILQPTFAGRALLRLIDKIDALATSDVEEDAAEYEDEFETWSPSRERAETVAWRNKILQAYVLEQAEVTRLAAQLRLDHDEEGALELEQHEQRLEILQNLLSTLGRLARGLGG